MPLYRWRALDRAGHIAEGEMDAASHTQLAEKLRRDGCLVLLAEPVGAHLLPPGLRGLLLRPKPLSPRHIGLLFRQLSLLLGAGLPLDRALESIAALGAGDVAGLVAASLAVRVGRGASLADAMEAESGRFPRIAIGMIRSGEAAGALPILANRVAEMNRRTAILRRGVAVAGLRGLTAMLVGLLAAAVLLAPVPTLVAPPVLALMMVLALDPAVAAGVERVALVLPGLGRLLVARRLARVLRGLSVLMAGGVPLAVALPLLREAVDGGVVAARLMVAAKTWPLSQAVTAIPHFPPQTVRLLAAGERAGRQAEAAARAAMLLDAQVRRALGRASSWATAVAVAAVAIAAILASGV